MASCSHTVARRTDQQPTVRHSGSRSDEGITFANARDVVCVPNEAEQLGALRVGSADREPAGRPISYYGSRDFAQVADSQSNASSVSVIVSQSSGIGDRRRHVTSECSKHNHPDETIGSLDAPTSGRTSYTHQNRSSIENRRLCMNGQAAFRVRAWSKSCLPSAKISRISMSQKQLARAEAAKIVLLDRLGITLGVGSALSGHPADRYHVRTRARGYQGARLAAWQGRVRDLERTGC